MATKQSKANIESAHRVWDAYPHKVILYIMDAQNVAAKDSNGKSDPFVVIEHGKFKKQTKIIEKTLNPVWNELFFIQSDPKLPIKFEMYDHDKIGSPDFMGQVEINLSQLPEDRIVELSPTLLPRPNKKKDVVSGQMHLRLYQSSAKETRPDPLPSYQFFYRPFKHLFKPGDLIGYSGHGILSGLQKVLTGNPITSVGMVVFLPNKWTGDVEPHVVELTRNTSRNMDAFSESSVKSGIYIFPLWERFHHYHGSNIVHFPLLHPLPPDSYKKVVEKIWECHKKNGFLDTTNPNYHFGSYYSHLTSFIKSKKNWLFAKNEKVVEASSFDFVFRLLKVAGLVNVETTEPSDFLRLNLYSPPFLIRQLPNEPPFYYTNNIAVIAPVPSQSPPPPAYSTLPNEHIPAYAPPPKDQKTEVVLSQLEFNLLMSMLDGIVLDDKLVVTKSEFRQKMIEKGIDAFKDERKFEAFYYALDSDNDGKVDIRELVCGFAVLLEGSADEKLLSAFKVFDRDGDNYIQRGELRLLLSALMKAANGGIAARDHDSMVEEFVVQIFAEFDKNHDGRLSADEFMSAAHNNSSVGNLFLLVSNLA